MIPEIRRQSQEGLRQVANHTPVIFVGKDAPPLFIVHPVSPWVGSYFLRRNIGMLIQRLYRRMRLGRRWPLFRERGFSSARILA